MAFVWPSSSILPMAGEPLAWGLSPTSIWGAGDPTFAVIVFDFASCKTPLAPLMEASTPTNTRETLALNASSPDKSKAACDWETPLLDVAWDWPTLTVAPALETTRLPPAP